MDIVTVLFHKLEESKLFSYKDLQHMQLCSRELHVLVHDKCQSEEFISVRYFFV